MKQLLPALLALLPALALGAAAPESPPAADLGDLLRQAEALSPAIHAAGARLEAARRMPSQVLAPPDPEVSIAYTNDGVSRFTLGESGDTTLALTWTQELPYPGKRPRASEAATFDAERAAKDLERLRLEVAAAVKTAYADLYRIDQTADILRETKSVLESLAQAARRRYEVGEGIQESVLKAQTEILRLEAEIARVDQDRRAVEVRLNAAVGRAADAPIGRARALPEATLPGDPEEAADNAAAASPAIGVLEAVVRREEAGVRLARLNLKPDFVWSASYQNRDGLDPMVMGMFGLRLPLYRQKKQDQSLLQRESELLAARHDLTDLQLRTRAAVRELFARARRADRLVVLFGQGVIPQARGALESAQAAYGVGRLQFLDLLNDLTVLLNARIDLAAQQADRIQTLAALEPLVFRELIRAPAASASAGGHDDRSR